MAALRSASRNAACKASSPGWEATRAGWASGPWCAMTRSLRGQVGAILLQQAIGIGVDGRHLGRAVDHRCIAPSGVTCGAMISS